MGIHKVSRRQILSCAALSVVSGALHAESGRPVRVLVPGPAGSAMDAYLRAVGPSVGRQLGSAMVIENMPGAGGTLATGVAARAAGDGQTLLIVSSNHVINPSLFKSLSYDVVADFSPITIVGSVPLVLVAAPSVTAKNIPELVRQMKARPGEFNYGSLGIGTVLHLAGEAFNMEAGVSSRHVPYKDAGALLADLSNGQIELAYLALPTVAQLVKAGRIQALAVTNAKRAPALAGVPAMGESVPGYALEAWIALLAPKGLSAQTASKYFEAFKEAMGEPAAKEALAAQGLVPMLLPPDKARVFLQQELERSTALAKRAGLTAQ